MWRLHPDVMIYGVSFVSPQFFGMVANMNPEVVKAYLRRGQTPIYENPKNTGHMLIPVLR